MKRLNGGGDPVKRLRIDAFAFLMAPLLLSLGCGAHSAAAGADASRGLMEAGVYRPDSAHMTFQVWSLGSDQKRLVKEGERLRSGDRLEIEVVSDADVYLSLVQFFADGSAAVLADGHHARAGQRVRLPAGGGYYQLDQFTGVEHLYFLASRAPLEQVDQQAAGLIDTIQPSPGAVPAQAVSSAPVEASRDDEVEAAAPQGPPAATPAPPRIPRRRQAEAPAEPEPLAGISAQGEELAAVSLLTTRGVGVVPEGSEASAYVQTDAAGVAIVHYWVEHLE